MNKTLNKSLIWSTIVIGGLIGCTKKESFRGKESNESYKIGLVSDIEGSVNEAKIAANELNRERVNSIIISGDLYENENIRRNPKFPNSRDNLKEMKEGITPFAKLGVPVYLISGNHEEMVVYQKGIESIRAEGYTNVFSIDDSFVDFPNFNIVGLGGYHDPRFMPKEGNALNVGRYNNAVRTLKNLEKQGEPTIFVTHSPPKGQTSRIDYVEGFGNVGDANIAIILRSPIGNVINVCGHIHEGNGESETYAYGNTTYNLGSVTTFQNNSAPNVSVIEIKNKKAEFRKIR